MTAHIKYPKLDPDWPATLSETIIKMAREDLGYRNLIISDDLDMKALRNHWSPEEIAVRAVQAGCNTLLYCNEPESPRIGLDAVEKAVTDGTIDKSVLEASFQQTLKLKERKLKTPDPLSFSEVSKIVGHPEHLSLAKAIKSGEVPENLQT
jgi:beta-N-acetylhexosaminidase